MNVINTIVHFIVYLSILLAPKEADRIIVTSPIPPESVVLTRTAEGGWSTEQMPVSISDGTLKMATMAIPLETRDRGFLSAITANDWLKTPRLTLDKDLSLEKTSDGFVLRQKEGDKTQEFKIQYKLAASPQEKAAVAAAETWLAGIDAGSYAQSWKDSSAFFQAAVTEAGWHDALTKVRKPPGEMKSRKLLEAKSQKSLPGVPDGEYVVIKFDTSFAAQEKAVETVTFSLEKDGKWKASGYFIR